MAQRKPLVIVNGQIQQLQSGDVLDASVNEVDVVSKQNDNAGAIVIGQPVYTKSNGNVDLAQADAGATVEVLGLVRDASIAAAASGEIQTDGVLCSATITSALNDNYPRDVTSKTFFLSQRPFTLGLRAVGTKRMSPSHRTYVDPDGVIVAESNCRSTVLTATTGEWDNVTGETGGLTAGAVYFLDPDTAGNLTQTAPTTVGDFVVRVGRAISTTAMEISVSQPVLL